MNTRIGLDIGSHNIKLIEMGLSGKTYTLLSAGSMPTPPKSVASSLAVDEEALIFTVKQLIKETGCKSSDVNLSLPEAQVFTRVIELPSLSPRELTTAIKWEAEQYIPLPLDQVNIDFSILREAKDTGTGKMDVLLVAAPKTLIEKYLNIVEQADLVPVAAETEILSTARALAFSVPTLKHVLIISVGAQTSEIAILKSGVLLFARSVSAGGDAMSRALMQTLEFSALQAEEYKKTYGLNPSILEGKIFASLKPVADMIVGEIRRAIGFFEERYKNEHIEAILVSGGGAKLPGLVSYVAQAVGIETQLSNPWVNVQKDLRFSVLDAEGPLFTVAVGLAMRP